MIEANTDTLVAPASAAPAPTVIIEGPAATASPPPTASSPALTHLAKIADGYFASGAVRQATELFFEILEGHPDLVIDAVDSVNPKAQILEACYHKKVPVISSMGAALRMNIFSIKAGDLFKTTGCPLARYVRSRLRRRGIKKGIFCIYSDTPVSEEPIEQTRILNEEQDCDRGRKRHKLGSTPTVTGAFGLAVAHHALLYLAGDLKLG